MLSGNLKTLSDVASHIAGFKPIADAMAVESRLSDQAIHILRQLNEAQASYFAEIETLEGTWFSTCDGEGRDVEVTDGRFIEDDLLTLCELGLLRLSYGSKGTRLFYITRAGAAVGG